MFRYGHHAHHPVIAIIVIVVIVALVALGIIALVRMRRHPHGGLAASWVAPRPPAGPSPWTGAGADSAINELRIRFARGEISSEEYWQRAAVLGYAPSPPASAGPAAPPSPGPEPSASPGPGPAAPPPPGPPPPPDA